jgi:hypothetical protein
MAVQTKRDRAAVTAGRTFDPEVIRSMSLAFRSVCNALDLKPVDHAVTRLLAEEIIELVETENSQQRCASLSKVQATMERSERLRACDQGFPTSVKKPALVHRRRWFSQRLRRGRPQNKKPQLEAGEQLHHRPGCTLTGSFLLFSEAPTIRFEPAELCKSQSALTIDMPQLLHLQSGGRYL